MATVVRSKERSPGVSKKDEKKQFKFKVRYGMVVHRHRILDLGDDGTQDKTDVFSGNDPGSNEIELFPHEVQKHLHALEPLGAGSEQFFQYKEPKTLEASGAEDAEDTK